MRRAGRDGFLRNVCVALGNRREAAAAAALVRALREDRDWLVRAHAAWALGEIAATRPEAAGDAGDALDEARTFDPSSAVREECARALERARGQESGVPSTQPSPPPA